MTAPLFTLFDDVKKFSHEAEVFMFKARECVALETPLRVYHMPTILQDGVGKSNRENTCVPWIERFNRLGQYDASVKGFSLVRSNLY